MTTIGGAVGGRHCPKLEKFLPEPPHLSPFLPSVTTLPKDPLLSAQDLWLPDKFGFLGFLRTCCNIALGQRCCTNADCRNEERSTAEGIWLLCLHHLYSLWNPPQDTAGSNFFCIHYLLGGVILRSLKAKINIDIRATGRTTLLCLFPIRLIPNSQFNKC